VFYLTKLKFKYINLWIINLASAPGLTFLALGSSETSEILIPEMINLGSASSFAVLAGSAITIAGASSSTSITGNIGIHPNSAGLAGMDSVVLNGINHGGDEVTQGAQMDLAAAYNDAVMRSVDVALPAASDLLGLNLFAGVYSSNSSLFLSGILTLDGGGNPESVWIFQMASTLITAANSQVALINGAQASRVFWQVGSSATLATESEFSGNILAFTSIGVGTGVSVNGSLLAQGGAVTFDGNNIVTVPESGVPVMLACGLSALCIYRRRVSV
jgi:hypothetical protein